jgi:hypothetical protein
MLHQLGKQEAVEESYEVGFIDGRDDFKKDVINMLKDQENYYKRDVKEYDTLQECISLIEWID